MGIPAAAVALFELVPSLLRLFGKDKPASVVEKVADVAKTITGETEPNKALEALQANPELMTKFVAEAESRAIEWTRMYLQDMQDARRRDIEIQKLKGSNKRADALIACAYLGVIAVALVLALAPNLNPDAKTFLATAGGMLLMKFGTAFDFEFGASKSDEQSGNLAQRLMGMVGGRRDADRS